MVRTRSRFREPDDESSSEDETPAGSSQALADRAESSDKHVNELEDVDSDESDDELSERSIQRFEMEAEREHNATLEPWLEDSAWKRAESERDRTIAIWEWREREMHQYDSEVLTAAINAYAAEAADWGKTLANHMLGGLSTIDRILYKNDRVPLLMMRDEVLGAFDTSPGAPASDGKLRSLLQSNIRLLAQELSDPELPGRPIMSFREECQVSEARWFGIKQQPVIKLPSNLPTATSSARNDGAKLWRDITRAIDESQLHFPMVAKAIGRVLADIPNQNAVNFTHCNWPDLKRKFFQALGYRSATGEVSLEAKQFKQKQRESDHECVDRMIEILKAVDVPADAQLIVCKLLITQMIAGFRDATTLKRWSDSVADDIARCSSVEQLFAAIREVQAKWRSDYLAEDTRSRLTGARAITNSSARGGSPRSNGSSSRVPTPTAMKQQKKGKRMKKDTRIKAVAVDVSKLERIYGPSHTNDLNAKSRVPPQGCIADMGNGRYCGGPHYVGDHQRALMRGQAVTPVNKELAAGARLKMMVSSSKRAIDLSHDDSAVRFVKRNKTEHSECFARAIVTQNACGRQLFAAAVSINGQRVWGQFDSQCTYTVMSGNLASNLNVTLKVISPIRSEMADGTILTIDTSTEEVLIQVDRQEPFTTTILVADVGSDQLLIGCDWIDPLGLKVNELNLPKKFVDDVRGEKRYDVLHQVDEKPPQIWAESDRIDQKSYDQMMTIIQPALDRNQLIPNDAFCTHPDAVFPIDTIDDEPIYRRQYPVPYKYRQDMKAQIDKWIETGRVKRAPDYSPWNTPLCCSPKKDATGKKTKVRVNFDARAVNKKTREYWSPLTVMDDVFARLRGYQVCSIIDIKSAFNTIRVKESDCIKLTFTFEGKKYMFVAMPFGVKQAPMFYQNIMQRMLDGIDCVIIWIDDIVIYSVDISKHAATVVKVLDTLTSWNVKVSLEKVHIGYKRLLVLGHVITPEGRSADPLKVQVAQSFRRPATGKQLAKMLGFFGYMRDYIPHYATIVGPLEKVKKVRKLESVWKREQEQAYTILIESAAHMLTLAHPRWELPLHLMTDFSKYGVGAVLCQKVPRRVNGNEITLSMAEEQELKGAITKSEMIRLTCNKHPLFQLQYISLWSKALNDAQRQYPSTKGEFLAGMMAMERHHHYLYGRHFYWITDHQCIDMLLSKRHPNIFVNNWIESILMYDFSVHYVPGPLMHLPDYLSRIYAQSPLFKERGKSEVSHFMKQLKATATVKPFQIDTSTVQEDRTDLIRGVNRKVCPATIEERKQIVTKYHSFAHVSGKALHQLIWSAGFYWESLRSDCEREYQKCKECMMHRISKVGYHMLQTIEAKYPHEHIGIDLFFMPMDIYGYIGCLVYVDYATRFTLVRRIKCKTARAIARKIAKILRDFGLPKIIQSDRGREFVNKIMRQLCVTLGIDRRVSTAYHPRCEGTAESHVKKVKHHLKRLMGNEESRWSDFVPAAQLAVNMTVNRRHKSSPFSLFFNRPVSGFEDYSQAESRLETIDEIVKRNQRYTETVLPAILRITREYNAEMRKYHDKTHDINAAEVFVPGTIVRVWNEAKRIWEGPCRVLRLNQGGAYELVYDDSNEAFHRNVAPSQMRLIAKAGDMLWQDQEGEEYVVDRVVDHRQNHETGYYQYRVRWEGFSEHEDTWEYADAFNSPKPIDNYWRTLGKTPDEVDEWGNMVVDDGAECYASNQARTTMGSRPGEMEPRSEDVQELPVEQLEGNERKRVTSSADELRSESDQTVVILHQTVLEQAGPPAVTTRSGRAVRSTLGEDYVLSSNVRVKRWMFALTN